MPEALGPRRGIARDQDAEMQLGQRDGTDGQFAFQLAHVRGDDDAGVEQRSHASVQGSCNV